MARNSVSFPAPTHAQQDNLVAMFSSLLNFRDTPMLIDGNRAGPEHQSNGGDQSSRATSTEQEKKGLSSSKKKRKESNWKEYDLDELNCAICLEPWRTEGDHKVSCLPCGHLYGYSCIIRWLPRPVQCPQCNAKCSLMDVRKLYAPLVAVSSGDDLNEKVESLSAEISSLKSEKADLVDIRNELLEAQDNLLKELRKLNQNKTSAEKGPYVETGSEPRQFAGMKEARYSVSFPAPTHAQQDNLVAMSSSLLNIRDTPMLIDGNRAGPEHQSNGGDQSSRATSTEQVKKGVSSSKKRRKESYSKEYDLDELNCAICLEPWRTEGDHQVSCLPCGHLYGYSCIIRWLQRPVQCPQCNAKCSLMDVRKLYAPLVAVSSGDDLNEKVESLSAEISSLKSEKADLVDIRNELLEAQDNLLKELRKLNQNKTSAEKGPYVETGSEPLQFAGMKEAQGGQFGSLLSSNFFGQQGLHCNFVLQHELAVEGARLISMDVTYQNLILARRISGTGGVHMLNKINLTNPNENEDIMLPLSTKDVKDLKISPCGRYALLASLGKKLSILSMASNSVVITCDLKVPAWSCSWDLNSPHYMYTGLQNGTVLMFDIRQTVNPLTSMVGVSTRPIHSMESLVHNPALGHIDEKLLTASTCGPCVWSSDSPGRPYLVPGLKDQGVCTSLAYGPLSDDIIASYYPKLPKSNVTKSSASAAPDSPHITGRAILGSQVHIRRAAGLFFHKLGLASANLSDVQTGKSAIINMENCVPLFAYGDKLTGGLRLRELQSLDVIQTLKSLDRPILDVKFAHEQGTGMLGCVSEGTFLCNIDLEKVFFLM